MIGGEIMENECPLIKKCQELVSETQAEHICGNVWIECEHNTHLRIMKHPKEWCITESEETK